MYTIPVQTLRPVQPFDLVRHVDVGGFAGPVGEPTVVDAVEADVVETDGTVAVAG